jgi:hypothetical protein
MSLYILRMLSSIRGGEFVGQSHKEEYDGEELTDISYEKPSLRAVAATGAC